MSRSDLPGGQQGAAEARLTPPLRLAGVLVDHVGGEQLLLLLLLPHQQDALVDEHVLLLHGRRGGAVRAAQGGPPPWWPTVGALEAWDSPLFGPWTDGGSASLPPSPGRPQTRVL